MDKPRFLNTPLERLIGGATAKKLATLGLETAGDLIHYYPRKYLHWGKLTPLNGLHPGEEATILVSVNHTQIHANRNGGVRLNAELTDGYHTSTCAIVFPTTHDSKPRRIVSTSGNSGIGSQLLSRHKLIRISALGDIKVPGARRFRLSGFLRRRLSAPD